MSVKRVKGKDAYENGEPCFFDNVSVDEFREILTFMHEPSDLKSIAVVSKTFLMSAKPYIVKKCKSKKELEDVFYNWALMSIGVVFDCRHVFWLLGDDAQNFSRLLIPRIDNGRRRNRRFYL